MTDTEIKIKGLEILTKELGQVEAERFVTLMNREPFDYTKWQKDLLIDLDIRNLSAAAMKTRKNTSR